MAAISTRAERVDGGWVVNGEKTYITNGVRAHFIVTAREDHRGGRPPRHLLPDHRPRRGRESSKLEKLGWHASDTATIAFQDVFVPEENLLGGLNEGFKLIMANFQWERLAMALGAVGAMQLAWERTADFARERQRFGRPLTGHQAIRHKLADLATSLYTCRCVTYDALRRFVEGEDPLKEVTMAKLLTQRASFELHGRLPADPRRRRLHARVLGRVAPRATLGSGRSAAAATRSCARSSVASSGCSEAAPPTGPARSTGRPACATMRISPQGVGSARRSRRVGPRRPLLRAAFVVLAAGILAARAPALAANSPAPTPRAGHAPTPS